MKELEFYRDKISKIDDAILDLLLQRFELCDSVGIIKKTNDIPIENLSVEKNIIDRLLEKSRGKIDAVALQKIYSEIFNESKRRQKELK
jgi:chorismate mutase